ncbi:hypothetical protein V6N13_054298 [Hibiscus sabdariffa]
MNHYLSSPKRRMESIMIVKRKTECFAPFSDDLKMSVMRTTKETMMRMDVGRSKNRWKTKMNPWFSTKLQPRFHDQRWGTGVSGGRERTVIRLVVVSSTA